MWFFVVPVLFILLLIAIILLLPVSFIIKTDENKKIVLLYKVLFKTFGENPDPNQPIVKALKKATGVDRLSFKIIKENAKKGELKKTIREDLTVITDLLAELFEILKNCTVKTLKLNIVCAEEDAAQTAITYGVCNAAVSSVLAFVHNNMRVIKKGEEININVNFQNKENSCVFEIVLVTPVYKLLIALLKTVKKESKRKEN